MENSLDVLVVTTTADDYAAVLTVSDGAAPTVPAWTDTPPTAAGLPLARRVFTSAAAPGAVLRVAVTQVSATAPANFSTLLAQLVADLTPACVAVSGTCSGQRASGVQLGDVLIASSVVTYRHNNVRGNVEEEEEEGAGELIEYNLRNDWRAAAETFVPATGDWMATRPRSVGEQRMWVLERLLGNEDPWTHPDRSRRCPDWQGALTTLERRGYISTTAGELRQGLALTEAGVELISRERALAGGPLPGQEPFRVHVGALVAAPPSTETEDAALLEQMSRHVRRALGVVATADAVVVSAFNVSSTIVVKGVARLSFGDAGDKDDMDDVFRLFAARASAECLLQFLRRNVVPGPDPLDKLVWSGLGTLTVRPLPSFLLNARHAVVPFFGRADVLRRLTTWAATSEGHVKVAIVHGQGGMGKTRLLIEECTLLRRLGHRAGFLRTPFDAADLKLLIKSERSTTVVLDYADTRPDLSVLLAPLADALETHTSRRFRLVLLARTASAWVEVLKRTSGSVRSLLDEATFVELEALTAEQVTDRTMHFRSALEAFAARLERPVLPEIRVPPLDDARYGQILYVHMAALATLLGVAFSAGTVIDKILELETQCWTPHLVERFHLEPDAPVDDFVRDIRLVLAAVTLRGGTRDRADAQAYARTLNLVRLEQILEFLSVTYAGKDLYIAPLEPDLLGEALVHSTLTLLGPCAVPTLKALFEDHGDGDSHQEGALKSAFATFARMSSDHDDEGVVSWIVAVLEPDVPRRGLMAFSAALAMARADGADVRMRAVFTRLGTTLATVLGQHGTPELAATMMKMMPRDSSVSLREVALWASTKMAEGTANPVSAADKERRADALLAVSRNLAEVGRLEESLQAAQEAVQIAIEVASDDRPQFLSLLARCLSDLAIRQREVGVSEAALSTSFQALNIRRELARLDPGQSLPDLAVSLNNISVYESELGRLEEALASTHEAVELYRALVRTRSDAFLPGLAASLNNLALRQRDLGQRVEALAAMQTTVAIYRDLARKRPDTFLPNLATSLGNLGMMQSGARGDHALALATTLEAVQIYRELARQRPDAFLPALAKSLGHLGHRHRSLGQYELALKAARESVDLDRQLAQRRPDAFLSPLASDLTNLSIDLAGLGQHEQAQAAAQEAVQIYSNVTRQQKGSMDALLPKLAASLNNLAASQVALGQRSAALVSMQQVVQVERQLVLQYPTTFLPDLAVSLDNLSVCHLAVAQPSMALSLSLEATEIARRLAQSHPEARHAELLATTLASLGRAQLACGNRAEAAQAFREAISVMEPLVVQHEATPALLRSLHADLNDATAKGGESSSRCYPQ